MCPDLYRALQRAFPGGIEVANPGEPFVATSYFDAETRRYRTAALSSGEYYRINCFACGDTRKRLWVNHMYGQEDASGRPMYFLARCYNEDCLKNPENSQRLRDRLFGLRAARRSPFAVREADSTTPLHVKPELPGTVVPLTSLLTAGVPHPALLYLVNDRGYTAELLAAYEVGYCTAALPRFQAAADRIIFPIYMRGEFRGWQARTVGAPKSGAKYYTMPRMPKRELLYNFDRAVSAPCVVVMEGVTDVHALPHAGVCTFGKSLSAAQAALLLTAWAGRPIVFLFDGDAQDESRAIVADLQTQRREAVIPIFLPEQMDPGQFIGRPGLWAHILSQCAAAGVSLPSP